MAEALPRMHQKPEGMMLGHIADPNSHQDQRLAICGGEMPDLWNYDMPPCPDCERVQIDRIAEIIQRSKGGVRLVPDDDALTPLFDRKLRDEIYFLVYCHYCRYQEPMPPWFYSLTHKLCWKHRIWCLLMKVHYALWKRR